MWWKVKRLKDEISWENIDGRRFICNKWENNNNIALLNHYFLKIWNAMDYKNWEHETKLKRNNLNITNKIRKKKWPEKTSMVFYQLIKWLQLWLLLLEILLRFLWVWNDLRKKKGIHYPLIVNAREKITTLSPNNFHLSAANPENLNCQKLLISFCSIYFSIFLYHLPYFLFAKIIFAFQTKSFFETNLLFRSLSKTNYKTIRWEIHHFRNIFVKRNSIKIWSVTGIHTVSLPGFHPAGHTSPCLSVYWKAWTKRRVSSTDRPTGKSFMVICLSVPFGSIMKRPLKVAQTSYQNELDFHFCMHCITRVWGVNFIVKRCKICEYTQTLLPDTGNLHKYCWGTLQYPKFMDLISILPEKGNASRAHLFVAGIGVYFPCQNFEKLGENVALWQHLLIL